VTPFARMVLLCRAAARVKARARGKVPEVFSCEHLGVLAINSPTLYLLLFTLIVGAVATISELERTDPANMRAARMAEHSLECRRHECHHLLNAPEAEFLACVNPCTEARETRWKRLHDE
jgi:hypothetical protein